MGLMRLNLFLPFFLILFALPALALNVQDVRVGAHPDKTRLVIELDHETQFRAFTLQGPDRLVVDLPSFNWLPASVALPQGSAITNVRRGALSANTGRLVFDLQKSSAITSSFILPAAGGKPARLVLDFIDSAAGSSKIWGGYLANESLVSEPTPVAPIAEAPAAPPPKRDYVIVIDAGHGGKDPGATHGSIREKHITLALAKALKQQLEAKDGFEVHLTRDKDIFIKLHERVNIARRYNPDLFISLHADSIAKSSVRGASIYTLSEKASDSQTARLAARENKADLIGGIDLNHEEEDVASILIDLVQRDTMNQSNYLAERLAENMKSNGVRLLQNPHRSAGFAVLKAPDVPSILIEAGFVSNAQEAKLLNQPAYRNKLAGMIADAFEDYLNYINNPQ